MQEHTSRPAFLQTLGAGSTVALGWSFAGNASDLIASIQHDRPWHDRPPVRPERRRVDESPPIQTAIALRLPPRTRSTQRRTLGLLSLRDSVVSLSARLQDFA